MAPDTLAPPPAKPAARLLTFGKAVTARLGRLEPHQWRLVLVALLGLLLLTRAEAWLALGGSGNFVYSIWTDRDLTRAARFWEEFPISGPELANGEAARIPGGVFYWLWAALMAFGRDPGTIFLGQTVLLILGGAAAGAALWRHYGAAAGIVGALVFLSIDSIVINAQQLWNPGTLPLPLGIALGVMIHAAHTGRGWTVPVLIACIWIGFQMHLTMLFLFLPLLWLVVNVPGLRQPRDWLWALLATILIFAPYAIGEALDGFPNTSLLSGQVPDEDAGRAARTLADTIWGFLYMVVPGAMALYQGPGEPAPGLAGAWRWAAISLPLLSSGVLLLHRRSRRDLAVEALLLLAVQPLIVFLVARHLPFDPAVTQRYALVSAAGAAMLLPIAGALLLHRARAGRRATLVASALVLVSANTLSDVSLPTGRGYYEDMVNPFSWRSFNDRIDTLRAHQGWTLPELVSRTVMLNEGFCHGNVPAGETGWCWQPSHAFAYPLRLEGLPAHPGAGEAPCAALFLNGAERLPADRVTPRFLDTLFGQDLGGIELLEVTRLETAASRAGRGEGDLLAVWQPGHGRCVSSFSNRYVFSPEETALFRAVRHLDPGEAEALPVTQEGRRRWITSLPRFQNCTLCGGPVMLLFDVGGRRDALDLTLHSNHLRGYSGVYGWYYVAMLERPVVELVSERDEAIVTLPIAEGWVGYRAPMSPLMAGPLALPHEGPWQMRLRTSLIYNLGGGVWPDQRRRIRPTAAWIGRLCFDDGRPAACPGGEDPDGTPPWTPLPHPTLSPPLLLERQWPDRDSASAQSLLHRDPSGLVTVRTPPQGDPACVIETNELLSPATGFRDCGRPDLVGSILEQRGSLWPLAPGSGVNRVSSMRAGDNSWQAVDFCRTLGWVPLPAHLHEDETAPRAFEVLCADNNTLRTWWHVPGEPFPRAMVEQGEDGSAPLLTRFRVAPAP